MVTCFRPALLILPLLAAVICCQPALAGTKLKNICRVKGQEENTLQGIGIVVGLKGTGDGGKFLPTMRPLATAMELMRNPVGPGGPMELRDARNVALVMVTATIPATGARQGDKIDCTVSSIGAAKSLVGGQLFLTAMQGPNIESERVYAFSEGGIRISDPEVPTVGRIHGGCKLEEDFFNVFVKNEKVTLVLDQHHAGFELAAEVADVINRESTIRDSQGELARAIDSVNIEVNIPQDYQTDPVLFVAQILRLELIDVVGESRVVINEATGSIVIDGNVKISPVVVSNANVVVEAGGFPMGDRFFAISPGEEPTTKLQSLLEALNAVNVPNADIIDIIKRMERAGALHARVVLE